MRPILKQAEQHPERIAAVKEALSDEDKEELLRQFHEEGGFTFRDRPGDGPTDGFMVSLPDAEEIFAADTHSVEEIADYHERRRELIDSHEDNYHGDWNDREDNKAYQDVSRHHRDLWESVLHGYGEDEAGAQHGIYHIPSGTTFSPLELSYGGETGYTLARKKDDR